MNEAPRDARIWWTGRWLVALFVVSRIAIIGLLAGRRSDVEIYKSYAQLLVEGNIPFREFCPEYPPAAFLFIGLPALLDPSLEWYVPLYRACCCAVDCLIWAILIREWHRRNVSTRRLIVYVIGTSALGTLLYDRIDIVLGAVLLLAMLALRNQRSNEFHFAVGLGIAFKLIPIVLVPLALARVFRIGKGGMSTAVAWMAAPVVISFGAVAALGGVHCDDIVRYHLQRPIQIESVPASVEMVLIAFGATGKVTFGSGSFNLSTPYEQLIVAVFTLVAVSLVMVCSGLSYSRRTGAPSDIVLFAGALSSCLALSKVLSPQYFLFLLPVWTVLPPALNKRAEDCLLARVLIICILTGWIFPWRYDDLCCLDEFAALLLVVRNACFLGFSISLIFRALPAYVRRG